MRTSSTTAPAALAALLLTLSACSTNAQWRRANREADWLLTKLRTLKVSDRMNRDGDMRLQELERERVDLDTRVRALQRDGRSAARAGDQAGLDEIEAQLEKLKAQYEELAAKY